MPDLTAQLSTGINALTREYEIITHNLANAGTVGYKRRNNAFSQIMNQQDPNAQQYSLETADEDLTFDFSQGNLVETGRKLDFALHGSGFFVIETTEGPLYTRNGTFSTNQDGQMVDLQGRIVAGANGPITIPANIALSQLYVAADGTISAGDAEIGRFQLVDFQENQSTLVPVGGGCYKSTDQEVEPVEALNVIVKQGYQESSNVQIIDELVDLIMVSRLYEANMQFINAGKDNTSSLINVAMG